MAVANELYSQAHQKNKKNMALFGLNFELERFPFSYGAPLDVHVSAFTGYNSRA